jgi:hypothetical protein
MVAVANLKDGSAKLSILTLKRQHGVGQRLPPKTAETLESKWSIYLTQSSVAASRRLAGWSSTVRPRDHRITDANFKCRP